MLTNIHRPIAQKNHFYRSFIKIEIIEKNSEMYFSGFKKNEIDA